MKSAEEWHAEFEQTEIPQLIEQYGGVAGFIRAIQRDALKAAMHKCSAVYEDWDEANNGGDHQAAAGVDAAHACIRDIADILPKEPSA
jgi:hypothetical protein